MNFSNTCFLLVNLMLQHHQPAANTGDLSREVLVHLRFNNFAVLMGPNKAETAVHSFNCLGVFRCLQYSLQYSEGRTTACSLACYKLFCSL